MKRNTVERKVNAETKEDKLCISVVVGNGEFKRRGNGLWLRPD
jgi:hypothetical protein